jgi:hypothetical protein
MLYEEEWIPTARMVIIDYYSGKIPDDQGRYLADTWAWPDSSLEACHDFIQWLFPLLEPSRINPRAPLLYDATIREFRSRPELQDRLRRSFELMLRFYGFEMLHEPLRVLPAPDFQRQAENWLRPGNHNHLRITRILKCLCLLGLEPEARAFFECLHCLYDTQEPGRAAISERSFRFWESAVS